MYMYLYVCNKSNGRSGCMQAHGSLALRRSISVCAYIYLRIYIYAPHGHQISAHRGPLGLGYHSVRDFKSYKLELRSVCSHTAINTVCCMIVYMYVHVHRLQIPQIKTATDLATLDHTNMVSFIIGVLPEKFHAISHFLSVKLIIIMMMLLCRLGHGIPACMEPMQRRSNLDPS